LAPLHRADAGGRSCAGSHVAPDLASVRTKIAVIRAHDLDELEVMPRPMLEVLDKDLVRLM
jgi:hypothetical protein